MRIFIVALSLLFGSIAAWAQTPIGTAANPERYPYEAHLSVAWQHSTDPKLGAFQKLDVDGKFALGGGFARYWPVNESLDIGLGVRAQYLPGDVDRVVNIPPFVGAALVNGSYRVWAVVAFLAMRYYVHQRFRVDVNAGVGPGFTNFHLTNLAGVTVGDGSATVPTWMLRAALLYAITDSVWVGPYIAYFAVSKWNATVPAATIGTREALLIGAVITVGLKLF